MQHYCNAATNWANQPTSWSILHHANHSSINIISSYLQNMKINARQFLIIHWIRTWWWASSHVFHMHAIVWSKIPTAQTYECRSQWLTRLKEGVNDLYETQSRPGVQSGEMRWMHFSATDKIDFPFAWKPLKTELRLFE